MRDCQVESIVFTNEETIETFAGLLCGIHTDIEVRRGIGGRAPKADAVGAGADRNPRWESHGAAAHPRSVQIMSARAGIVESV